MNITLVTIFHFYIGSSLGLCVCLLNFLFAPYLGQPKRHLLTTGWSMFIGAKRLRAGDAVLFIRYVGIIFKAT